MKSWFDSLRPFVPDTLPCVAWFAGEFLILGPLVVQNLEFMLKQGQNYSTYLEHVVSFVQLPKASGGSDWS